MAKAKKNAGGRKPSPEQVREAVTRWAALVNSTVSALLDSVLATIAEAGRDSQLRDVLNMWSLGEMKHSLENLNGTAIGIMPDNPLNLSIPSATDMLPSKGRSAAD